MILPLPKEHSDEYQNKIIDILPDPSNEAFDVMAAFVANMLLSMNKAPETFIETVNHYMKEYCKQELN